MARFVAAHRNYSHGVRNHVAAHLGPDGKMVPEQRPLAAEFDAGLRNDEDVAVAKSALQFRGLPIFEDGREVGPSYRISVFDSEVAQLQNGWTDDETELVVKTLRTTGPVGSMYVEVIPAAAEKPWNGYDNVEHADKVVELALAIDADLTRVVQYERENRARPAVLAALDAAIKAAGETITVSA